MGLLKSAVKGAVIAGAAVVCPPAAGALVFGNVAHKTGKALRDDNNANAGRHVASVLGSVVGADIDVDAD